MRKIAVVFMITLLSLASWVAGDLGRAGELPRIFAFGGNDFTGDHTHKRVTKSP